MCSEARGLSGWSRKAARWIALIAAAALALGALAGSLNSGKGRGVAGAFTGFALPAVSACGRAD